MLTQQCNHDGATTTWSLSAMLSWNGTAHFWSICLELSDHLQSGAIWLVGSRLILWSTEKGTSTLLSCASQTGSFQKVIFFLQGITVHQKPEGWGWGGGGVGGSLGLWHTVPDLFRWSSRCGVGDCPRRLFPCLELGLAKDVYQHWEDVGVDHALKPYADMMFKRWLSTSMPFKLQGHTFVYTILTCAQKWWTQIHMSRSLTKHFLFQWQCILSTHHSNRAPDTCSGDSRFQ